MKRKEGDSTTSESNTKKTCTIAEPNPPNLFDICIKFVAENVHNVESFAEFPEQIGANIFQEAINVNSLSFSNPECFKALLKFVQGYGPQVISTVNLARISLTTSSLITKTYCSLIEVGCAYITHLDLGYSEISDEHEILLFISTLPILKVLNLEGNKLTDDGINKLTAPCKVMKKGLCKLEMLNLSGNRCLKNRVLHTLSCLKALQALDLSKTLVTIKFAKAWSDKHGFNVTSEEIQAPPIVTSGWVAPLIEKWKAAFQRAAQLKQARLNSNALKFYFGSRKLITLPDSTEDSVVGENLVLTRVKTSAQNTKDASVQTVSSESEVHTSEGELQSSQHDTQSSGKELDCKDILELYT